jgi:hypothetical protein
MAVDNVGADDSNIPWWTGDSSWSTVNEEFGSPSPIQPSECHFRSVSVNPTLRFNIRVPEKKSVLDWGFGSSSCRPFFSHLLARNGGASSSFMNDGVCKLRDFRSSSPVPNRNATRNYPTGVHNNGPAVGTYRTRHLNGREPLLPSSHVHGTELHVGASPANSLPPLMSTFQASALNQPRYVTGMCPRDMGPSMLHGLQVRQTDIGSSLPFKVMSRARYKFWCYSACFCQMYL